MSNNSEKHYNRVLTIIRTYDAFDPVKSLRSYLDKAEIEYIFGVDTFYFTNDEDRELARWVM